MRIVLILLVVFSAHTLQSQTVKWSYDLKNEKYQLLNQTSSSLKTSDKGYIVVANTYNTIKLDENFIVVVKIDKDGSVLWETKFHSETGPGLIFPRDIIENNDGGYSLVCTENRTSCGKIAILIVKLNICGDIVEIIDFGCEDEKTIKSTSSIHIYFTSDSTIRVFYIKENRELWSAIFSTNKELNSSVKIDSLESNSETFCFSNVFLENQKFIICVIIKTKSNSILRYKSYISDIDGAFSFSQEYDAKESRLTMIKPINKFYFLINNLKLDSYIKKQIFISKLENNLSEIWSEKLGNHRKDYCNDFVEASNDGVFLMVFNNNNFTNQAEFQLFKLSYIGEIIFEAKFGKADIWVTPQKISKFKDSEIICSMVVSDTTFNEPFPSYSRFICFVDSPSSVPRETVTQCELNVYPNPATEYIELEFGDAARKNGCVCEPIEIYDLLGRRVANADPAAALRKRVSVANLPSGVYFVRAGAASKAFVKIE